MMKSYCGLLPGEANKVIKTMWSDIGAVDEDLASELLAAVGPGDLARLCAAEMIKDVEDIWRLETADLVFASGQLSKRMSVFSELVRYLVNGSSRGSNVSELINDLGFGGRCERGATFAAESNLGRMGLSPVEASRFLNYLALPAGASYELRRLKKRVSKISATVTEARIRALRRDYSGCGFDDDDCLVDVDGPEDDSKDGIEDGIEDCEPRDDDEPVVVDEREDGRWGSGSSQSDGGLRCLVA